MNPYCVPDTVLGIGNTVLKKTDMASALIQFIPRWFGRSEDDGINSEGCNSYRQTFGLGLEGIIKFYWDLGWSTESPF